MRELISNAENRRLIMLEYFIYGNPRIAMEDLKKALDMTDSTLIADVEKMKAMYPGLSLRISDGYLYASFSPTFEPTEIYVPITHNKLIFRLVRRIFFEEDLSLTTLAAQEHASVSSAYRLVHEFNAIAKKQYHLQIESSPCRMVGAEEAIRAFYRDFFLELYPGKYQPFSAEFMDTCSAFVHDFSPFFGNMTTLFPFEIFALLIAIAATRYRQGHRKENYTHSDDFCMLYDQCIQEKDFAEKCAHYSEAFGFPLDKEALFDLCYPLSEQGYRLSLSSKKATEKDRALEKSLVALAKRHAIPLEDSLMLACHLNNALFLAQRSCFHPMIIFNSAAILCMSAYVNHHAFTIDAMKELYSLQERVHGKATSANTIHLFYVLMQYWIGLLNNLRRQYGRLNIKVESHFGPSHEAFMTDTLSSIFSVFADFTSHTKSKSEKTPMESIDLLITNLLKPNLDGDDVGQVLRVRDSFLSSNALFEIGDMIQTIYDKENQLTVNIETFLTTFCAFQGAEKSISLCKPYETELF